MSSKIQRLYASIFLTICIVALMFCGYAVGWNIEQVMAESPAETVTSAPPCTPIAATGNIVISRCEDEDTGTVLYVNNIGFMTIQE